MNNSRGILEQWYTLKRKIKELEDKEKFLKFKIHEIMNENRTNTLRSNYFYCERKVRKRTDISKKNVPQEIWDEHSRSYEYPVLLLKRNERQI